MLADEALTQSSVMILLLAFPTDEKRATLKKIIASMKSKRAPKPTRNKVVILKSAKFIVVFLELPCFIVGISALQG
ncbi:MAG: hypothetical protein ACXWIN_04560 [Burkholderiaceae bacterium]